MPYVSNESKVFFLKFGSRKRMKIKVVGYVECNIVCCKYIRNSDQNCENFGISEN